MANELLLGIDVGTTSVKAGLLDRDGVTHATFAQRYPTQRGAQGWVEQAPNDWVRLVHAAFERFVAQGYAADIKAIGLCSQVNTHVFVGSDGAPLMPAILWQDGRARAQAAALEARVSEARKRAWWGAPLPIDASHVLSRMAWVAENRPRVWDKTKWVMLPKDYCLFELTGRVTTDPLSNIGLVGPSLGYVRDVFDLVPGASEKCAPLVAVTETVGRVRADAPLAGVRVVSGTMDAWAGIVGAGGAQEGATVYLSGTSEILGMSSQTIVPTPGIVVFPRSDDIRIHAAPTQSGGDAQLWFTEVSGLTFEQMADLVAATPRRETTPLFLPQLEGERAPLWDSDLRAAFLALSRRTGLGDLARAVYEGVAFSARHALEMLERSAGTQSAKIGCAGGGFRSEPWVQIRADVLGRDCHVLAAKEPGVLGAAMIAGVGAGWFGDLAQAHDALVRYDRVIRPRAPRVQGYDRLFALYKEAVATQADLARRLTLHARSEQEAQSSRV